MKLTAEIKNRWTPDNEDTDIPAYSSSSNNIIQSSRYVEDGSFIRMKNISLGYNLPVSKFGKTNFLKSFRIYLSGQNLLTISDYSGFDASANGWTGSVSQTPV